MEYFLLLDILPEGLSLHDISIHQVDPWGLPTISVSQCGHILSFPVLVFFFLGRFTVICSIKNLGGLVINIFRRVYGREKGVGICTCFPGSRFIDVGGLGKA